MASPPIDPGALAGVVRVGSFGSFYNRFDELLAEATSLSLYFIHSRRWRENHDAAIKAFLRRPGVTLEVFLPDIESHELMFSLARHFEDGPLIPSLVVDAYRYFARLERDFGQPTRIWLFNRYPTYTAYRFDRRAIVALYSNTAAKKELPALEVETDSFVGRFLIADSEDLKRECRVRPTAELGAAPGTTPPQGWDQVDYTEE